VVFILYPILFHIGSIPIYSFGVATLLSILAGVWLTACTAKKYGESKEMIYDYALYAGLVGILGARVWEVIFGWEKFSQDPISIFAIHEGGLSVQGSLFFGFVFTLWYTRKNKIGFWKFADIITPGVLLGQALGRLVACTLAGGSYGAPTDSIFGIKYPPGSPAYARYGDQALWPAEIFEGIWDLLILALILILQKKNYRAGTYFLLYVLLYSAGRFFLEYLRGDSLMIFGLKSAQLISLIVIAISGILLYRNNKINQQKTSDQAV
jgi:phosphatidylglycerol:prolipoprotein diacylglycerol transferase